MKVNYTQQCLVEPTETGSHRNGIKLARSVGLWLLEAMHISHQRLEDFFEAVPSSDATERMGTLRDRLEKCINDGANVSDPNDREHLQAIARELGDGIFRATGRYPAASILPYISREPTLQQWEKWNVPFPPNPYFTDRTEVLEAIRTEFRERRTPIQVISGLGGMGKTQTAIQYADTNQDDYDVILWVDAETEDRVAESATSLADALHLSERGNRDTNEVRRAVQRWLGEHEGWLLIADNTNEPKTLQAVRNFLPIKIAGHVLITSRATSFDTLGVTRPILMNQMSVDDSFEFLLKRTGRDSERGDADEMRAARTLAQHLDGLPLALEQAAAYISARQTRFGDYVKTYERLGLDFLDKSSPQTGKHDSVKNTWLMNLQEVEATPVTHDLLCVCALLDPDAIPLELFIDGAEHLGENISKLLQESGDERLFVDTLVEPLTKYSLVRKKRDDDSISMHRVLHSFLRGRIAEGEEQLWSARIVNALDAAFPAPDYSNWGRCERLLPQARVASEYISRWDISSSQAGSLQGDCI